MPNLSWTEWNKKSKYRCLHYKFKEQLHWLKDFYPEKIDRLQRRLDDILAGHAAALKEDVIFLQEKIARLTDKFETTLKEIEGRKLGHFKNRPEHGTIYYIDLDGGNDGSDGLGTGTAWLTFAKYTTTTVRTAGDIAKVRANTDEVNGAVLAFDEDGDEDDYIEIRGCSSTDDPWSDGSDIKPILDRNNQAASRFFGSGDDYWKINRIVFTQSGESTGDTLGNSKGWYFLDSEFTEANHATGAGLLISGSGNTIPFLETCTFSNNTGYNLKFNAGGARLKGCTIDGGALPTPYGIYFVPDNSIEVELVDCIIGVTNAHGTKDAYIQGGGTIRSRNTNWGTAGNTVVDYGSVILEEDADSTYGAYLQTYYQGTIMKDTGVKTGAAIASNKMLPNTNCGINNPLIINGDSIIEYPFRIECTTGVSKTVTVQIRSLGTWGTYPVATELFLEFWYLDHAVNATRTKVVSADVLAHASNWVNFTVTFTPLQTGLAYGTVKLGKFEDAGDGCYVNGEST